MYNFQVLVPFRGSPDSKSRLREQLNTPLINETIYNLFTNTLEILAKFDLDIIVLTTNKEIKNKLLYPKVRILYDPGNSINSAILSAISKLDSTKFMLVMPDLPGLNTKSIGKALKLYEIHQNIIAPTGDGGTALAILDEEVYEQGFFGENSSKRIREFYDERSLPISTIYIQELQTDLDTKEDWLYWEERGFL